MSKKEGRVLSDAEALPERVDIDVGRSNNVQALSTALTHRWAYVGAKCNTHDYH